MKRKCLPRFEYVLNLAQCLLGSPNLFIKERFFKEIGPLFPGILRSGLPKISGATCPRLTQYEAFALGALAAKSFTL